MAFKVCVLSLLLVAAHMAPVTADPGDAIGSAVTIVNLVTGEFKQSVRNLATGDDVLQDETIAVGTDGIGELMLRDETKLALGPGAQLVLDRFVYDPNKSGGSIVLNLVKGGFRFITGVATKPTYMIRTPAAAIVVRGTVFDVYIEASGAIWLLLHEGSIRACNDAGECRELDDPCRLLRIGPGGSMAEPGAWNALPDTRDVNFETAFPFVVKPPEVDPRPIFTRGDIELGQCADPGQKARKTERIEPGAPPSAPRKSSTAKKKKQAYAKPVRKGPKTKGPILPGISIGIGIGGGGGGRGGGGHGGGGH